MVALLVIIGVWALFTGYSICRTVVVVVPHSYAAWTTGDLLVEYMDTHNGGWTQNWGDLENARDSLEPVMNFEGEKAVQGHRHEGTSLGWRNDEAVIRAT